MPLVSRDVAIDPFSLSATAAEPLTGVASAPLSFFLLGATGRTGLPFLSQALARGHFVTIYVRNVSKLPAVVVSHPHLRAFTGDLHEADKVALAIRAAKPDVVYVMLASETAPYTAVSTGTLCWPWVI
jgi:dTDP-4-dehydrorhamnose reductase